MASHDRTERIERSEATYDYNETCPTCGQTPSMYCLQARRNEVDLTALVLDIHDGLVQNLFAASTQVHTLQRALREGTDPTEISRGLERVAMLLECSLREIRTFVHAFGPHTPDEHDLCRMVEDLAEQRRELSGMDIHVRFEGDFPTPPLPVRVALYRILQETLSNAHRHAQATHVDIHLYRRGPTIGLRVSDDGKGFDPDDAFAVSGPMKHLGLLGIRERVRSLGGTFHVTSAPGEGTTLHVELPAYEG